MVGIIKSNTVGLVLIARFFCELFKKIASERENNAFFFNGVRDYKTQSFELQSGSTDGNRLSVQLKPGLDSLMQNTAT